MFTGMRMECGHLRDFRFIPAACLQDQHPKAVPGQISSKRSAARAGADNDEIVLCSVLFRVKGRVSQLNEDET